MTTVKILQVSGEVYKEYTIEDIKDFTIDYDRYLYKLIVNDRVLDADFLDEYDIVDNQVIITMYMKQYNFIEELSCLRIMIDGECNFFCRDCRLEWLQQVIGMYTESNLVTGEDDNHIHINNRNYLWKMNKTCDRCIELMDICTECNDKFNHTSKVFTDDDELSQIATVRAEYVNHCSRHNFSDGGGDLSVFFYRTLLYINIRLIKDPNLLLLIKKKYLNKVYSLQ